MQSCLLPLQFLLADYGPCFVSVLLHEYQFSVFDEPVLGDAAHIIDVNNVL